jgi:Tfp pilus assembly protein PilF
VFVTRPYTAGALALLVAASVTACGTTQKNREEAELRLRLGTSLLEKQNYPSALRELMNAEKLDPKNEIVQNNLGLAYYLRGRSDLAEQHLLEALRLKPDYSDAHNNYAVILIDTARYAEALAHLQKVTSDLTYQNPARAWVNMGRAYFLKGDYRAAKEKFLEAIKLDRDNCQAHTFYGRSLLELADYPGAARSLDNAVMICKPAKFDEAHYFSGLSYYKLGRTSDAVARMEEVIKINPEGAYARKAESLLKLMK